ncbi:hypothetical protein FYN22_13705 [Acinetobacter johnsonii]|nr:hypothetical protein FYN22_13705 [Acinetobacter johnsonii]
MVSHRVLITVAIAKLHFKIVQEKKIMELFISFNSWLFIDSWWIITSNLHSKFISFIKKIK